MIDLYASVIRKVASNGHTRKTNCYSDWGSDMWHVDNCTVLVEGQHRKWVSSLLSNNERIILSVCWNIIVCYLYCEISWDIGGKMHVWKRYKKGHSKIVYFDPISKGCLSVYALCTVCTIVLIKYLSICCVMLFQGICLHKSGLLIVNLHTDLLQWFANSRLFKRCCSSAIALLSNFSVCP